MKNTTITVTVNGMTITGTAQEIAQVIAAMNGTAVKAEKPKKEVRSDYVNKNKGFTNFTVNVSGKEVKFTHSDGSYLNEGFIRKALNARVKTAGAKWNKESKVWEFVSKAKAEAFAKACTPDGLDAEVDAIIAATNERNAKKSV